jgi:hypothetical protein
MLWNSRTVSRADEKTIDYLAEENRVLREQTGTGDSDLTSN